MLNYRLTHFLACLQLLAHKTLQLQIGASRWEVVGLEASQVTDLWTYSCVLQATHMSTEDKRRVVSMLAHTGGG